MLFNRNELNEIYINEIKNRYLSKNGKFKDILSKLNFSDKIYKYKDFEYVYGHSETFGYYFIAITENKEGFLWVNPIQYKNEEGFFFSTEKFNGIEDNFKTVFNLEDFRDIYVRYIRTDKLDNNMKTFMSIILFRSFPWFSRTSKSTSAKVIGVYLFSVVYDFRNSITDLQREIDLIKDEFEDGTHDRVSHNIIKTTTFTSRHINKILKKEISFIDIMNYPI